jgi:hypothetical protein
MESLELPPLWLITTLIDEQRHKFMKNQMSLPRRARIDKALCCPTHQLAAVDLTASLWLPETPNRAENHQDSRLFTLARTSGEQLLRGAARARLHFTRKPKWALQSLVFLQICCRKEPRKKNHPPALLPEGDFVV